MMSGHPTISGDGQSMKQPSDLRSRVNRIDGLLRDCDVQAQNIHHALIRPDEQTPSVGGTSVEPPSEKPSLDQSLDDVEDLARRLHTRLECLMAKV